MTSPPTPPLLTGHVLEISFPTFTPRITVHSERQLTVEIIAGDGSGFSSRAYTAVTPAKGGFMRLTGRVEVKSET
jgi:hypothetical protein